MPVEHQLGERVHVDRPLALLAHAEVPAGAVDRGGRGVDERHPALRGVLEHVPGEVVVGPHHQQAVPLGRVGAGALVEDRLELRPEVVARRHARGELVHVHVVGDAAVGEIEDLAGVAQVVHDQDVGVARGVQGPDQVAADEAGAAGDDDHGVDLMAG